MSLAAFDFVENQRLRALLDHFAVIENQEEPVAARYNRLRRCCSSWRVESSPTATKASRNGEGPCGVPHHVVPRRAPAHHPGRGGDLATKRPRVRAGRNLLTCKALQFLLRTLVPWGINSPEVRIKANA